MKLSVTTPCHPAGLKFLTQAWHSLAAQNHKDFEWIILANNGCGIQAVVKALAPQIEDESVHIVIYSDAGSSAGIGGLKRHLASLCKSEVVVEFDCDDLLTPNCLAEVASAFENPHVQMVYSNSAQFTDGSWASSKYSERFGWRYREYVHGGNPLNEAIAWPPSYHSFRRIWWAPDHVRAWRKSAYDHLGGHDASLAVGDDHDLTCQFYIEYGERGIKHIDKCLYLYREHPENTVKLKNAEIQVQSDLNYLKYIEAMGLRWAKDNGLPCYDLGGRFGNHDAQYKTVDIIPERGVDFLADLNERWPWPDHSIGVLSARHILEHLADPIHAMNEAYRVLAPGGLLLIEVPSVVDLEGKVGLGAFRDCTHKQFFSHQNFWYFTDERYTRFIRPGFKGRFQASRIETYMMEPQCPVVAAELIALKGEYATRPAGEILI